MTDCSGPRSAQSGHCVGEREAETRNNSRQEDRFSLARVGIISTG